MLKFETNQKTGKPIEPIFWRQGLAKIVKLAKSDLSQKLKKSKVDLDRIEVSIAVIGNAEMKKLNYKKIKASFFNFLKG